ncbi:MAG: DNA polymerase III subunit gamma/tau [Gammaproteobacteria bacterium]|nr:DNA polymerase III subunit gamma/tau [Gammaproteobacteria bacterium]
MSYQVLARKWRPRDFSEMVGQQHVLKALIHALDDDRLHHAYLFTGTRGVGKTTLARILAKSLNCEKGVSSMPCGECSACTQINEGRFVDLIEVDAASRTKVEDTRELLDNVQYAPSVGRYKVYLIDEVHMLSSHSFNALLKTLEEPPPHVKFLLATTEPQKLPITILSRCLQFNLKRMTPDLIVGQLEKILDDEKIDYDKAALHLLARGADGSMRDGLSLLDQAIAFGRGKVNEDDVREMMGTLSEEFLLSILEALAQRDAASLIEQVHALAERAPDFDAALSELLALLHQLTLLHMGLAASGLQQSDMERFKTLADKISEEDVQLFYQIGLHARRDMLMAPEPVIGFEMALLRMLAFQPVAHQSMAHQSITHQPHAHQPMAKASNTTAVPVKKNDAVAPPKKTQTPRAEEKAAVNVADNNSANQIEEQPKKYGVRTDSVTDWHALLPDLKLKGLVNELASNCVLKEHKNNKFELLLAPSCKQLLSDKFLGGLTAALQKIFGADTKVDIQIGQSESESPTQTRERQVKEKQSSAVAAMQSDPFVQGLKETFGAELDVSSVESHE